MSVADDARALFQRYTRSEPEGTWSAPGRVNLIGEHTDYNDGFVLPFAIDKRTVAAVGRSRDGWIRVISTLDTTPVELPLTELRLAFPYDGKSRTVPEWAAYPLGVAWALIQAAGASVAELSGVTLAFASDVPLGAGLSSSAAIEGATATALNDIWRFGFDRLALGKAGRRAENEAVGAPTGIMDQVASLFGQRDEAVFLDCRTLDVNLVPLRLAENGLEVLVIDTGVRHSHATGGYRERREACERGSAAFGVTALRDVSLADLGRATQVLDEVTLRRVRHVVTENQRVLDTVRTLREFGPRAIGPLLSASHDSMRDDFEISVPELDLAVDVALGAGAIGARMTGGGFGGAAIALVERGQADAIAAAVRGAFGAAGFGIPNIFAVHPAAGAGRDA